MASCQITSWNVKGLRSPIKRMKILRHLKRLKSDIALLQETHLEESDFSRMQNLWVGRVWGSASKGRKAGTLILLHKRLAYDLVSVDKNEEGRFISVQVKLQSRKMRITNIYAPNSPDKSYFTNLTSQVAKEVSIPHLIGWDFDSVLHNSEDRSSPHYRSRPSLREQFIHFYHMVNALQLIDTWRLQHPLAKEFTFFSPAHDSLARLDYFLCTPALLNRIRDSSIHDINFRSLPHLNHHRRSPVLPRIQTVAVPGSLDPKCQIQNNATWGLVGILTQQ